MSTTRISLALRTQVRDRANNVCEYCLMPEEYTLVIHQIDHIISEKHGGRTEAENLGLACVYCNTNKGSDIASIDYAGGSTIIPVRLFNPRTDRWDEHFSIAEGEIVGLTAVGRVTARLLQFNSNERVVERKLWLRLKKLKQTK